MRRSPRQAESATNRSLRSNEHHDHYPRWGSRTRNKKKGASNEQKIRDWLTYFAGERILEILLAILRRDHDRTFDGDIARFRLDFGLIVRQLPIVRSRKLRNCIPIEFTETTSQRGRNNALEIFKYNSNIFH